MFINTGVYSVQAAKPTHGTAGLITPACNNGALTVLRNVVVTGFDTGIVVNEHTDADNINLGSNINGLSLRIAYHASRFGRIWRQRCTHMVTVTGEHGFSIEQLDIEHAGPGQTDSANAWQATVSDVNDPGNRGVGDVNYWVVLGNVGVSRVFTRNGGTFDPVPADRIGPGRKRHVGNFTMTLQEAIRYGAGGSRRIGFSFATGRCPRVPPLLGQYAEDLIRDAVAKGYLAE